jgi:hypothetical protein
MSRTPRQEVFSPDEIAIAHITNRVVRRCFLLGDDPLTGKNFDHRKVWIERLLERQAACFGIDLLCFSVMSNHLHLVLRSRPDVVKTWDDTEVARRWLMLCPLRTCPDGSPEEPSVCELNSIRHDPHKLQEIRHRLSDFSWWMRLLCQRIAQRANAQDQEQGKFWQARYRAVRIYDEASLLACAAYVDLNPIRAALAERLEDSDFTSVQRRIASLSAEQHHGGASAVDCPQHADRFLSPLPIDEARADGPGPAASKAGFRCSDKGFLSMPLEEYLKLLDWTARRRAEGKRGVTPDEAPPILERLGLSADTWCELVENFGRLFHNVAGCPAVVDQVRTLRTHRRYRLSRRARQLLEAA